MIILGISAYYHDSAAAIIKNGEIIFAAQEERYTRKKNDSSFPTNAIVQGLLHCHLTLDEIDSIVYYEKPFLKFERILQTYLSVVPKGFTSFMQAMHAWTKDKLFLKQHILDELKSIGSSKKTKDITLLFTEHHLAHAASAFFPSSFEESAILTIDGVGEYATTTLASGQQNSIKIVKEIHYPHSIGLLYSAITYYLGFKVNSDEYKIMGLAAYGNAESEETKQFIHTIEQELIHLNKDGSYSLQLNHFSFNTALTMVDDNCWERLFKIPKRKESDELTQSHCNLAYAFQQVTEKAVIQLCYEIKQLSNSDNLCLAGGVALNCVINGIIKDKQLFKHIFIQPASGDAGGALGAALAVHYIYNQQNRNCALPDSMQNSLLGTSFTDAEIQEILQYQAPAISCKDDSELCAQTAQLIAQGKVIGWYQGNMEFGPRALGNRSILADARNSDMQLRLNLKIKNRESFRPFAPAVLEEDAAFYFDIQGTSPYMLQVHKVKQAHLLPVPENYPSLSLKEKLYFIKSTLPAITHVDFTARIQTVNKEQHPLFYKLIKQFKDITGCSMLVNTSFNIKDEPIVCTPKDAYTCFIKTDMDVLVIGKYIFMKSN